MECGVFNEPDGVGNDIDETSTVTSTPNDDSIDSASDKALSNIKAEFDKLIYQWDATFVFVTNEIGSGLHATTLASRKFVDAQGWLNQHLAFNADMVVHMISGTQCHQTSQCS
jgi:adenosyl cobinamide kinase/adenosyl cobinamide phosphate guanylyltransferase